MSEKLLEVNNLRVSLGNGGKSMKIIRGFELRVRRGEIVGVLGESGSGKTVSTNMIARIYGEDEGRIDEGQIVFDGLDLAGIDEKGLNGVRGKRITYIFQNPSQALNPYKRIGRQLEDMLKSHGIEYTKDMIIESMKEVGLDRPGVVYDMFPSQLSGGQNQRIMICQSILCRPDLIIADEPTSSIDAMLRKRILDLLIELNERYGTAILIITHDFDVAKYLCSRIVIMYGGLVLEEGRVDDLLSGALHPYTRELIRCAGSLDSSEEVLYTLDGRPPVPSEFRDECPFYARCRFGIDSCRDKIPDLVDTGKGKSRCPVFFGGKGEAGE